MVNLISELQEQMCRFQEEIHTRIMEKRAMEAQGESGAREAHDQSPDVGLGGSDVEEFCCRCGGQNVGRLSEPNGRTPPSLLTPVLLTPLESSTGFNTNRFSYSVHVSTSTTTLCGNPVVFMCAVCFHVQVLSQSALLIVSGVVCLHIRGSPY